MKRVNLATAENSALLLHPDDNVAIARVPLSPGQELRVGGRAVALLDPIPVGHKVALAAISAGEAIRRYGQAMGLQSLRKHATSLSHDGSSLFCEWFLIGTHSGLAGISPLPQPSGGRSYWFILDSNESEKEGTGRG